MIGGPEINPNTVVLPNICPLSNPTETMVSPEQVASVTNISKILFVCSEMQIKISTAEEDKLLGRVIGHRNKPM